MSKFDYSKIIDEQKNDDAYSIFLNQVSEQTGFKTDGRYLIIPHKYAFDENDIIKFGKLYDDCPVLKEPAVKVKIDKADDNHYHVYMGVITGYERASNNILGFTYGLDLISKACIGDCKVIIYPMMWEPDYPYDAKQQEDILKFHTIFSVIHKMVQEHIPQSPILDNVRITNGGFLSYYDDLPSESFSISEVINNPKILLRQNPETSL